VDDYSSKLGLGEPYEKVETIDENHMNMVRCFSREDVKYKAILGVIQEFLGMPIGDTAVGMAHYPATSPPSIAAAETGPRPDSVVDTMGDRPTFTQPAHQPRDITRSCMTHKDQDDLQRRHQVGHVHANKAVILGNEAHIKNVSVTKVLEDQSPLSVPAGLPPPNMVQPSQVGVLVAKQATIAGDRTVIDIIE
jgi:hypothetical protein